MNPARFAASRSLWIRFTCTGLPSGPIPIRSVIKFRAEPIHMCSRNGNRWCCRRPLAKETHMASAASECEPNCAVPPGTVLQERVVAEEIAQSAHSISEAVSRGHSRRRHVRESSGLRPENGLPVDSDRWLGIAAFCRLHRSRRDAAGRATPSEGTQSLHQDRTAAHTFSEHLSNCHNWRAFMLTSRATVERFSGPRGRGYAPVLQAAERSRE